jgi:hypothetical protein
MLRSASCPRAINVRTRTHELLLFFSGDGMLKTFVKIGSLACLLSFTAKGHTQALPTAVAHGNLQAGVGWSAAVPDYGTQKIQGVTGFGDFDFTPNIGVEADIHYIALETPTDLAENSYEIGPRYVYRIRRFAPYGKAMVGLGSLVIQEVQDNPARYTGNYLMFSFGGGLDIRATHHIVIRVFDFEAQKWPSLGNGLSPYVGTVGVAYRFR